MFLSRVNWSRDTDRDTWQRYCTAIGSSGDVIRTLQTYVIKLSIISIKNAKCKIKNCNRSKSEILSHFQIGCEFIEYCLFNTTNTKSDIYTFWYNFDTVLYKFLETGTSDRCLIYILQRLRFSGFSLYPLSFFLYSPFK